MRARRKSRKSRTVSSDDGFLDFRADDEIDFDKGLPDRSEKPRRRHRAEHTSKKLGEGKYKGIIDFDEDLPSRAEVQKAEGETVSNRFYTAEDLRKQATTVQTLIFSKDKFTRAKATSWAKEHDFRADKVDESGNSFRLRQKDPGEFKEGSFRTISMTDGVKAVVGRLKSAKKKTKKAVWSTAFVNDLPDSSFLLILPGGKKDEEGKTKPRTLRKFPVRDQNGKLDLPHVRNAIARIPQASIPADQKAKLQDKARKLLAGATKTSKNETLIPDVLTWDAVRSGEIPEAGESGLPASLRDDVPPAFRFWKCEDVDEARRVRDALVESQLFAPDAVRLVNGEVRRAVVETVQKLYLTPEYDDGEPVEIPVEVRPIEKAAALLADPEGDEERPTTLFGEDIVEAVGIETIVEKLARLRGDYVIAAPDTDEVRKAIGGPCFRIMSRSDLVFATNAELVDGALVEWVQLERTDELLKQAFAEGREIPIFKAEGEERIVFGIVLEPNEVDAQGDIISEEEIRSAAHKFMEDFGNLGIQHTENANGRVVLLETFIAPVAFSVEEQQVKKGTWLFKERIRDDVLWAKVKKGEITGFSIGGSAIRKPVQ